MSYILDNFPEKYDRAVVLYAASRVCLYNLTLALSSPLTGFIDTDYPEMGELEVLIAPDITLDVSKIPEWINFVPPEMPALGGVSITEMPTLKEYVEPIGSALDFADANFWINDEEDSEMLTSRVQLIGSQVQDYATRAQQASSKFAAQNTDYQAEVQKILKQAELDMAEETQKLQEYSAAVQTESAKISSDNAEIQQRIAQAVQEMQAKIAAYQTDIQNVSQKNQIIVGAYTAKLGKKTIEIQQFNAKLQEKVQVYNWNIQQYTVLKNEYIEIFGIPPSQQQAKQQKGGN